MAEGELFERSPLEKLLALKAFLDSELGHRVHLLVSTREQHDMAVAKKDIPQQIKLNGKVAYWAKSVKTCSDRLEDVESLIEWHDCESTGGTT